MADRNIPLNEQETNIIIEPLSDKASVYTNQRVWLKRFQALALEFKDDVVVNKFDGDGMFISVPKSWIKIRKPRTRKLSPEDKAALANRLSEARKIRKENNTNETR